MAEQLMSVNDDVMAIDSPEEAQHNGNISVNTDVKTAGQPLSEFLMQLEDYTPTVSYQFSQYKFDKLIVIYLFISSGICQL